MGLAGQIRHFETLPGLQSIADNLYDYQFTLLNIYLAIKKYPRHSCYSTEYPNH